MANFEKDSKQKRTFKVQHAEPGRFRLDYILLPIGFSYNREYLKAKRGDILQLFDGGAYRIDSVRVISLRTAEADLLARMRYGVTIKGVLMRWQDNARLEGHLPSVVSTDECLWIVYERGSI